MSATTANFPAEPGTDDERRSTLLRLMAVPDSPVTGSRYGGIYVLGCFARYVTVYAQQVRALNLIDALAKSGRLRASSRVAVIGAGIAGLTAAAAAASRGAASVKTFERLDASMRLQRTCEKRFVHPHIYDWPYTATGPEDSIDRAKLPLMDWTANRASDIVESLDGRWKEALDQCPGRLHPPRFGCGEIQVGSESDHPFVTVDGGERESFDLLILAVGFGLDRNDVSPGYWADTALDAQETEAKQTWFVSGYGDGALTDLMRLCVRDFRHGHVIQAIDEHIRLAVGAELKAAEAAHGADLTSAFRHAAEKIAPALKGKLESRAFGTIWLNCAESELFSQRSSTLNRLICAYLLQQDRFKFFPGKLQLPVQRDGEGYVVQVENGDRLPVSQVLIRHGPDRALQRTFPDIAAACDSLAKQWQAARQDEDWTRKPMYGTSDFDLTAPQRASPLRVEFGDRIGCVVITGSRTPNGATQTQRVNSALRLLKGQLGESGYQGRTVDPDPISIPVEVAFGSSAAYERTIRALCEADIAVFDITGYEAAVMLMLGVRAAVRRGVTITLQSPGQAAQPFNLASINPIAMAKGDADRIATAMAAGLAALQGQASTYLDLPVFDSIRHLGQNFAPKEPAQQVLLLRWFQERYAEDVGEIVANQLRSRFRGAMIVTTLDSQSPQLVEQRLYADIRRTKVCVADWTGWRPNVFFEIGVRLAVNKLDPIHVLCVSAPPGWTDGDDQAGVPWPASLHPLSGVLKAFFSVTEFSAQQDAPLKTRLETFEINAPSRGTSSTLSTGRTYQVVLEALDRRAEPGGWTVFKMLSNQAEAMAGPAVPERGGIPVLFAEALGGQVRRAALEYGFAAWYYLAGRYKLVELIHSQRIKEADPALVEALRQVGEDLRNRTRGAVAAADKAQLEEIFRTIDTIEGLTK